ncbi:MAG: dTDP-4-dehydrorhamnose 3,5-epimerase [Scytolyngbya sp. HA4215-MV1]|jgi:dTDP-4-dehydrorhamnose 3,5-epimerase|nr:dTDP-4-dehydrorhamnose 3,5-epimerase [Scytolyngbya sp. HA4215-MV1]
MDIEPTEITDVLLLKPKIFQDARGFFYESYNQKTFMKETGITAQFVQDNHSCSKYNILRGLHYQIQQPQGKLVRAVVGSILDVAVDLRRNSPSFGQSVKQVLSAENQLQLWIPPGFAHGFLVLSETAEVLYKATDYYAPQHERCILWNDADLAIDWGFSEAPILSAKDQAGQAFKAADCFLD